MNAKIIVATFALLLFGLVFQIIFSATHPEAGKEGLIALLICLVPGSLAFLYELLVPGTDEEYSATGHHVHTH